MIAEYDASKFFGVLSLSFAGLLTILAIFSLALYSIVLARRARGTPAKSSIYTSLITYYVSLLVANLLQGIGTTMNFRWVNAGRVISGDYCRAQAGIKQAGNIGTAVWSFVITLHLFNLLFLRWRSPKAVVIGTHISGWAFVTLIVIIGPLALETKSKGRYFGVAGYWCWISSKYPVERTLLEYLVEFLSAGLCLILYTAALLRVRGNLQQIDGKWTLRWVNRGEGWKLSFGRDLIDSYMLQLAQRMIWFPIFYSIALIPIAVARLTEFGGRVVPFWVTILSAVIFNLSGFVNVLLFVVTRRYFPDSSSIPEISMPRKKLRSNEALGITPFVITAPDEDDDRQLEKATRVNIIVEKSLARHDTVNSVASDSSTAPLRRPERF